MRGAGSTGQTPRRLYPTTPGPEGASMIQIPTAALLAATTLAALAMPHATAQSFPTKPLRLIVSFAPGGNIDITGRTIAPGMAEFLGQPVVVENRPGAGGSVAAEFVARAPADGYTLLMTSSAIAINVTLYEKLAFDTVRDLTGIAPVSDVPTVISVHPSVPAKNIKDFVAIARSKKGRITYASAGIGGANHLAGELFRSATDIEIVHVPYKGSSQALADLIGGQVDSIFDQTTSSLPFIRAGKIRPIAVMTAKRSPVLPEVPTLLEQGLQGIEFSTWSGVFTAAAVPRDIVARLNASIQKTVRAPGVREKFAALGAEVLEATPDQFNAFVREQVAKLGKLVKISGAKAE
jgi:tripartite-type tricarboxylate transporter receptor subunit TctC